MPWLLQGTHQGIDHAFPGAAELYRRLGLNTILGKRNADAVCVVEAVAGHHDGLVGLPQIQDDLEEMFADEDWDNCPNGKMPSLHGETEFRQAERAFERDFPDYKFPSFQKRSGTSQGYLEDMLDTRMMFSCLVDADYSVSASDDDPNYLEKNSRPPLAADAMLKKLEEHCAQLRKNSKADSGINALRNEVYDTGLREAYEKNYIRNYEPQRDKFGRAYATGRRKDATAKVWIKPGSGRGSA